MVKFTTTKTEVALVLNTEQIHKVIKIFARSVASKFDVDSP